MDNVELVGSDGRAEVYRFVVGPIENNVYVVRCKRTGEATLIDAANEHDRLLRVARRLGVTSVLETHGHWDHIGAVEQVREAGIDVWVRNEDAGMLPSYDHLLDDDAVHQVGDLRLRTLHTPGHTPGSICFALEESSMLFTGDTLFPGGPGNTNHDDQDFANIITSIDERIFGVFGDGRYRLQPIYVDEWVERGW